MPPPDPILVLGAGGQIGHAVCADSARRGVRIRALTRAMLDITDAAALDAAIPEGALVINAAAEANVDRCERDEAAAMRVNAEAPGAIARICARRGAHLFHLSTDAVFDGSGARAWRIEDRTDPVSAYGRSKLAGETAIRDAGPRHLVLRVSWVFSARARGFVRTMCGLARRQREIRVVTDQRGRPTPAQSIAAALLDIVAATARPGFAQWGTHHFAGDPPVSRFEMAQAMFADRSDLTLTPVSSAAFGDLASRPANAVLDCDATCAAFGLSLPRWREALPAAMAAIEREVAS
jgi:dTDP-4-dehydrorhamnose reductase